MSSVPLYQVSYATTTNLTGPDSNGIVFSPGEIYWSQPVQPFYNFGFLSSFAQVGTDHGYVSYQLGKEEKNNQKFINSLK